MYKAGMKLTDEILDFKTVEDFLLLKKDYKQSQKVQFLCETKIKKFLTYIKETYGADYLKQFRVHP